MKYEDVRVGMLVYLKDGYQGNFRECIGRVIAKRNNPIRWGSNILVDFSLDGNEPPFQGHKNRIFPEEQHLFTLLPEALETPKYKSRWWVEPDYLTEVYNNVILDGGLL